MPEPDVSKCSLPNIKNRKKKYIDHIYYYYLIIFIYFCVNDWIRCVFLQSAKQTPYKQIKPVCGLKYVLKIL